ncbi:putative protein tyrosine kinase [Lyophyllum shimeji]|uniref:Protein kinase domain-containing protein n=1 Tax=Lyophyllum shimeji TaxID=47721 RepID=A0A9P3UQX2_LYOSH|nr:putative protein tyrosine kinase [Lyophyllum shimeji]
MCWPRFIVRHGPTSRPSVPDTRVVNRSLQEKYQMNLLSGFLHFVKCTISIPETWKPPNTQLLKLNLKFLRATWDYDHHAQGVQHTSLPFVESSMTQRYQDHRQIYARVSMLPIDLEMQQLTDELGYFYTHSSPVEEPSDWLRANIENIQSTWNNIPNFSKEDIAGLEKVVYPRFFAHTVAQLKLHESGKDMAEFKINLSRWTHHDETMLLLHHWTIKATLWAFSNRSRGNDNVVKTTDRDRITKFLRLDVLSIAARILAIAHDDRHKGLLLDLQRPQTQSFLDLLQGILDGTDLEVVRASILRLLLESSDRSEMYPSSFILHGIVPQGKESRNVGTYGDIWEGTFGGDAVAIKVLKVDPSFIKRAVKEATKWRQLCHPYILSFLGVYQWPGSSYRLCLVSPWMKNGNIVQYLKRNPPQTNGLLCAFFAR